MLEEILRTEIAPPENGWKKDVYGLQVGNLLKDKSLRKIIVCLDPTKSVIMEAIKQKAHLIISHHGLTHQPLLYFNDEVIDRIALLTRTGISLFVVHTAWDAAPGGVSETLAKIAGMDVVNMLNMDDHGHDKPIGRIGVPFREGITVKETALALKRHLQLESVQIGGNLDAIIKKAAIVGGKGLRDDWIRSVLKKGCDTYITGEYTYPEYLMARTLGLNLIATSHYKSEKIGMKSLQMILALKFPRDEFIFFETGDPIQHF